MPDKNISCKLHASRVLCQYGCIYPIDLHPKSQHAQNISTS